MSETKVDRDTVIDAIKGEGFWAKDKANTSSFGIVANVAIRLGVTRATIYSYMKRWKTVKAVMMDERNSFLDLCESKLANEVNEGNITAIIFALKTIGKSRGYIERYEYTGADSEPIQFIIKRKNDKKED